MEVHNLYINITFLHISPTGENRRGPVSCHRVAQNGLNLDQYEFTILFWPFYLNHISWHKGSMPKYRNKLSLSASVLFPILARSATLSENLDFTQNFYPHHIFATAPLNSSLWVQPLGAEKNFSKGWVNRLKCVQINKTSVQTAERLRQLEPLVIKSQFVKSNHSYPKIWTLKLSINFDDCVFHAIKMNSEEVEANIRLGTVFDNLPASAKQVSCTNLFVGNLSNN